MSAVLEVIVSLLGVPLVFGATALAFIPRDSSIPVIGKVARACIGALGALIVTTYGASFLGLPVSIVLLLPLGAVGWWLWRHWPLQKRIKPEIVVVCILVILFIIFSIPYLAIHDGLPTGDSQKAIIWGQSVLDTTGLPDYAASTTRLNRDPVDFFTPGLHTLTALIMQLSPLPLTTVGYLAITLGLGSALVGAALIRTLWPQLPRIGSLVLVGLLVLSHERFLRYLREPGYHLQNSLGELLLMALLWLAVSLTLRWRRSDAVLFMLVGISLALSHQFSSFLAAFTLVPFAVLVAVRHVARRTIAPLWIRVSGYTVATGVLVVAFFAFGLSKKLPHLFTATPHLLPLTPSVADYPRLMGAVWLALGVSGLTLLLWRHREQTAAQNMFSLSAVVLLLLSQAPRFGIDIPPVRALFYSVIPLSVTGTYLLVHLIGAIKLLPLAWRRVSFVSLMLLVATASWTSVSNAYTFSHRARTNSTLTQEHLALVNFLTAQPEAGAVLIDDHNKRSSSWLVLSKHAMYTRLASALQRQMEEARQSDVRYELYLNQLAYEKIFSLGSLSQTAYYARQQGINWVTGISGSSVTSFAHNPALATGMVAGDTTLFQTSHSTRPNTCLPLDGLNWLYRASTLANDIGDAEDTFEALPASLTANRLSDPIVNDTCTFRQSTATRIPLTFNVGDYVTALWNQDGDTIVDRDLALLVQWQEFPSSPITVSTETGATQQLSPGSRLIIPANTAPISDDGFITVWLENPNGDLLSFDVIALGLHQTL